MKSFSKNQVARRMHPHRRGGVRTAAAGHDEGQRRRSSSWALARRSCRLCVSVYVCISARSPCSVTYTKPLRKNK